MEQQLDNIHQRQETTTAEATALEEMLNQRMDNHFNQLQNEFNAILNVQRCTISRLEERITNLTTSLRESETRLAELEESQIEFIDDQNRMAARMFVIDRDLTQTLVSQLPHIMLQQPPQQQMHHQ
jgi:predicted nuclease with TOPRIM domain